MNQPIANRQRQRQRQGRDIDTAESAHARGIQRGRVALQGVQSSEEQPSLTERRAAEFAWAEQHLPEEHPGLVVSAMVTISLGGNRPTTKGVMARLESQGRTMAQIRARDSAKGRT